MNESEILVSVIIPVYNVEKYIDRCIQSVVHQTHSNIEIILINDGSTDTSELLCRYWANRDSRIRFFSKENEGLGITRNMGIELATADYIMFVDSDDWIELTIVEKLLKRAIDDNADMVVCNRYDYKESDGTKVVISNNFVNRIIYPDIEKEAIYQVTASQWAKLFKKELFKKYDIKQPAHYYEDAVTPVLVALSKIVSYVDEPLYYYVVDRPGSITNDITSVSHMVEYLKTLVYLFKKLSLFEKYNKELFELCRNRINWNLYRTEKLLQWTYDKVRYENVTFLEEYWNTDEIREMSWGLNREKQFMIWGSYNLMTSMKMLMRMNGPEFPRNHYCFSSIISSFEDDNGFMNECTVYHNNEFRKYHLIQEFKRKFIHSNLGEFSDIQYVVIDFLEERYDIGVVSNHYYTISDAFVDSRISFSDVKILKRCGKEIDNVWKSKCDLFISYIDTFFPNAEIILVKNKLSEEYGNLDERKTYDNIDEIRMINQKLDEYYFYFQTHCHKAKVVEASDSDIYYTDEEYRHGCYPWHLNYYAYKEISDKIIDKIWKKKK